MARAQEADVAGPSRQKGANGKSQTSKNKTSGIDERKTRMKAGTSRQSKKPDAGAKSYINLCKSRKDFIKWAQEEGIETGEPNSNHLLPLDICQKYRHILTILRNRWNMDLAELDPQEIESHNNDIRDANRVARRDENVFLFPFDYICNNLSTARHTLENIRSMDEGPKRTEEAKKMFKAHFEFAEKILEQKIDYKRLIPEKVRQELGEICNIPDMEAERTELGDLFRRPTLRQWAYLEPALKLISKYYDFFDEKENVLMDYIFFQLGEINKDLVKSNLEEGLRQSDHVLPIDHLLAINSTFDEENLDMTPEKIEEIIKTSSKRMAVSLQCFGVSDASVPQKHTEGVELPEGELRQMQEDVANFEGLDPQESTQSHISADGERPNPQESTQSARDKTQQREQRGEQHQNADDSSPKLMSLPETKPLIDESIRKGITECGKVLSVQKAGYTYRVFTNMGTDVVPVYKMFPGSSFPKSVRQGLHETFGSEPQPKGMEDHHIEILDTIVHRAKTRTYTWVVYKWMLEKDPKPRIMSHTDLTRRLGRIPALRQEKRGLEARKKRLTILQCMREYPNEIICKGAPPFSECSPYMDDGLDEEDEKYIKKEEDDDNGNSY